MDLAKIKFEQMDEGYPIVLKFEIDELEMRKLKQLRFEHYSAEWAHFVVENRTNKTKDPIHDYDFIYGPIADDRVGVQLWRYENGMIDFSTMLKRIKYMKGETFQYFFGTERAVNLLRRI